MTRALQLDHLAVAGETLAEAVAHVEEALGVAMGPGGRHVRFGTHNRLLGLADGLYLEAIAVDPAATPPEDARWFDLDRFSGAARLNNWICRTDDLDAAPDAAGRIVDLARNDLRWQMAVPEDGILPFDNLFPALIRWQVAQTPGDLLPVSGCRLIRLEVAHPDASELTKLLGLDDARVAIVPGNAALRAGFETPHGTRWLT